MDKAVGSAEHLGTKAGQPPLISIQLDAELSDAFELMQQHDIRHLPVLDGERLVGIVSERDLGVIESLVPNEWETIVVAEAMTPSPYAVHERTPVPEVAQTMAERKYGCVVIIDSEGRLVGIFTTSDALRLLASEAPGRSIGDALQIKARVTGAETS